MWPTNWWLQGIAAAGLALGTVSSVAAQGGTGAWGGGDALGLVRRAIERRSAQIADSALAGYQARAVGRLLFLAQLGDTSSMAPRVVKADQIAVDVYWKAPSYSKQLIVGLRDTLLLPGDIGYYQDRYGIVQSNFPDLIRLGEGRDVRDVPHPLAPNAAALYEYAVRDSLTITLPDRRIDVYEVAVRPRDARAGRVVGSLFLDRGTADLVRMSLTFTDAAILDRRIERLSVILENALVEGRFWLPRRQELEVARAGTWLDIPVRGIIRGSWQICCYQVNASIDSALFRGPAIASAPLSQRRRFEWPEPLAEVIGRGGDIATVTEEDIARVHALAGDLVARSLLTRTRGGAVAARSISDFVRFNRVEGLALGAGLSLSEPGRYALAARGRYGIDDRRWKLSGQVTFDVGDMGVAFFVERDHRDVGDVAEASTLRNSLAAQEFGSDYSDPYGVEQVGGGMAFSALGIAWDARAAAVRHSQLAIHATPAHGGFERTLPAWRLEGVELSVAARHARSWLGGRLTFEGAWRGWDLEAARGDTVARATRAARLTARARYEREGGGGGGGGLLRLTGTGAGVVGEGNARVAPQSLVYLGGPVSGPGYGYHTLSALRGGSLRVEYGVRVPFPSMALSRYGRSPGTARVFPYFHVVGLSRPGSGSEAAGGLYPSVGIALEAFFDLLRVDVAGGFRGASRRWLFALDLSEAFRAVF